MIKHKKKIILGIIVAAVLALVFLWGGNAPGLRSRNPQESENTNISQTQAEVPSNGSEGALLDESGRQTEQKTDDIPVKSADEPATEENKPQKSDHTPMTAAEKIALAERMTENAPPNVQNGNRSDSEEESAENSGAVGKDKDQNVPAAEDRPTPIEPENAVISDRELTCTLSVRCDTVLANIAWLDREKVELVPKDGVIYAEQTVTFYEGESVFNLLVREMKRNKIHMEFENTPIYNSAYIEGIGNLYEFDCGELSGWMYKVNGWFPNYGCSRYQLKEGDRVEWVYTCDLGSDVGGKDSARNGR